MLVAFAIEEEVVRAIRNRLYISGVSVRAEKAKDKARKPASTSNNKIGANSQ